MSDARPPRGGFAARPADAEAWVRRPEADAPSAAPSPHTARLTIDITPMLRGRIKVIAFQRGQTVAEMLRALLEAQYGGADAA